jgi:copper chaperone CopZ
MTCDSCVKDVSEAVQKLGGITKIEASLADQLVVIEGTGPFVPNSPKGRHLSPGSNN